MRTSSCGYTRSSRVPPVGLGEKNDEIVRNYSQILRCNNLEFLSDILISYRKPHVKYRVRIDFVLDLDQKSDQIKNRLQYCVKIVLRRTWDMRHRIISLPYSKRKGLDSRQRILVIETLIASPTGKEKVDTSDLLHEYDFRAYEYVFRTWRYGSLNSKNNKIT